MLAKKIEAFEAKAAELIDEALKLAHESDAPLKVFPPGRACHRLTHYAILGFISAVKVLIFAFHREAKKGLDYDDRQDT